MSDLLSALERAVRTPTHWLIAAAATLLAAAVITLVALRPAPPKMCRGAEEALAPAWGAAREDDVHRAFAKTGNARAEEAFSHVHSVVERYARSWVAMRTDACEATRVRGEQSEAALDLRMACLAQRERELKATVDLFANPDDKTIEKSVEAAAQLTPVESCGDLDSLRAPFAPPKDEGQRRAVDDLRQRLAELHVAFSTARLSGDPAVEQASALALEAAGVGYEPVHAEALYEEGVVERNLSKLALAQVTLFRAAIVAEAVRHDVLAAKAWTELLQVEGHDLRHFEESSRTGELAEAAVRRSSSDALRADLLCARAGVAYRSGAATDMRTDAEQCIRLRDRVLGSAHPDTLIAREELADALWDLGEVEASLPLYQSILETRRTLLGPTHPDTIRSLSDVGQIAFELGDYRAAIPILVEATGSPNLPFRHAYFETYLADALVGANRIDEGIATFAEAHSALMSLQGPLGEDLPALLADFSRFLVQREIDVQAESNANESLALSKATFGREQERGEALGVRALVEARRGATKRAIEDADGALAVKQKLLGERAEIVPLLARGLAYLATQREGDALVDLERAAGLGEKYKGDVAIRSEVRFALARALVATKGDAARASELATRAASELDSVGLAAQAETVRSWMRKSGVVVASSKP